MKELTRLELVNINGGTDPDGCAGCSAGVRFRNWLGEFLSAMGRQGHIGQPGGMN